MELKKTLTGLLLLSLIMSTTAFADGPKKIEKVVPATTDIYFDIFYYTGPLPGNIYSYLNPLNWRLMEPEEYLSDVCIGYEDLCGIYAMSYDDNGTLRPDFQIQV